ASARALSAKAGLLPTNWLEPSTTICGVSKECIPHLQRACRGCGAGLGGNQSEYCTLCGVSVSRTNMIATAQRGRAALIKVRNRDRACLLRRNDRTLQGAVGCHRASPHGSPSPFTVKRFCLALLKSLFPHSPRR